MGTCICSVTCKHKFVLQTLRGYFQLELNGSKHQVQRVESILNLSFAPALFRTLLITPRALPVLDLLLLMKHFFRQSHYVTGINNGVEPVYFVA